jgi:hypothetical protein
MSAGRRTYHNLRLLLQRLAGLFIGLWIGAGVSHDFPSVYWLTKFGALLGFGLLAIAHYRTKTPTQSSVELRAK